MYLLPPNIQGNLSGQRRCLSQGGKGSENRSDFYDGRRYSCSMELLGRLPELAACKEALSGDRRHAAAAIIAGPPGIGKTSLWRAVADSQSGDAVVLSTTGISGARAGLAAAADPMELAAEEVVRVFETRGMQ